MNRLITKESPQYRRAILALFFGSLVAFGAEYCLQPIIPVLAGEFLLSPAQASLAMSLGTGGMAASMLAIAIVAERLERKKTMSIALLMASLITVALAFCGNFHFILLLRLMQGVLLAGFPALAVAYINEEFDYKIVGFVVGIYISANSLGGLSGRVIISALTDYFDWRLAIGAIGAVYLAVAVVFWFWLPPSTKAVKQHNRFHILADFKKLLTNRTLLSIYFIAFGLMGAFVCVYNYIGYIFLAPPYNLSQTLVGCIFMMFLVGTVGSTTMGWLSDRHGSGKVLLLACAVMLAGALTTLLYALAAKIAGLGIFTFGFFGAHSTACGWAGKVAKGDKAQASSMYMLFYYVGSSVVGTLGGYFLAAFGWTGVVAFTSAIIACATAIALALTISPAPRGDCKA